MSRGEVKHTHIGKDIMFVLLCFTLFTEINVMGEGLSKRERKE